jgi:hypothetical protein
MTLIFDKNDSFACFASCVRGAGLIRILSQVARRVMDGEGLSDFSAGKRFTDDFKPAVKDKNYLTAVEFFEGKFYSEKLKPIKTASKKGRRRRQTHE